jgi:hypothetical protein
LKDIEIERIQKLRLILSDSVNGRGIAASMVAAFKDSDEKLEKKVARMILLGIPVERSVKSMLEAKGESHDLLRYIVTEAKVNLLEASKNAEKLSSLFERWVKLKRVRMMEQNVMEMRGHIVSVILGAVVSLLSSLAPVISTFQQFLTNNVRSSELFPYLGISLTLISSVFLGFYLSPRRAYIDPILAFVSYLLSLILIGPLIWVTVLPL